VLFPPLPPCARCTQLPVATQRGLSGSTAGIFESGSWYDGVCVRMCVHVCLLLCMFKERERVCVCECLLEYTCTCVYAMPCLSISNGLELCGTRMA